MSPPWANLAGMAIGGPLYGVYFVLYVSSTYVLVRRSAGAHAGPLYRSVIFITGLVLFVAVTANFFISVIRPFLGFIGHPTAPGAFFDDNSQITTTVQNIFASLAVLVSDGIIIYRLWIVWGHNKYVIILPCLTLLGLLIALVLSVQTTTHVDDISLDKGLTPGLVFTLTTNLYSTGLISWKIWQITKASSAVTGSNLRDFLAIIVESAAIYTYILFASSCKRVAFSKCLPSRVWAIFYIVTHQINSNVQFVALIPLPAVAGIANALIQTRIGLGKAIERTAPSSRSYSFSNSGNPPPLRFNTTGPHGNETTAISRTDLTELKPMTI
ncbi:hypothetical protein R3P38DRAFT_3350461 [Favolaschia claudopus]|uniref:Uncharacterized protein n=1 Tax=Favolaschia claudopus TaxID=2862362 RepID=A0AAW0CF02_9AGAR